MLEYRPFSERTVKHLLDVYASGGVSVIDLETSARCLLGTCIYCDSKTGNPDVEELSLAETIAILNQGIECGVEMLTICGLGEPLDDPKLTGILYYCRDHNLSVSMFTNTLGLTDEHLQLFKQMDISLLVKCDSLNPHNFDKILGRKGAAEKIYVNIERLLEIGLGGAESTNLALSIVPTRLTVNDIPGIIDFCKSRGVFPSIGEVEFSGRARTIYDQIALSSEELIQLRKRVEDLLGHPYCRQLCPSTIAGLHIGHTGECVAHKDSGLSCPWFLLDEPDMISLGNLRRDSLATVAERLRKYRVEHMSMMMTRISLRVPNIFGGCGGKAEEILATYERLVSL